MNGLKGEVCFSSCSPFFFLDEKEAKNQENIIGHAKANAPEIIKIVALVNFGKMGRGGWWGFDLPRVSPVVTDI